MVGRGKDNSILYFHDQNRQRSKSGVLHESRKVFQQTMEKGDTEKVNTL
jgi:hypothetical protein